MVCLFLKENLAPSLGIKMAGELRPVQAGVAADGDGQEAWGKRGTGRHPGLLLLLCVLSCSHKLQIIVDAHMFLHLHTKLLEVEDGVYQRMETSSENDGQWMFDCSFPISLSSLDYSHFLCFWQFFCMHVIIFPFISIFSSLWYCSSNSHRFLKRCTGWNWELSRDYSFALSHWIPEDCSVCTEPAHTVQEILQGWHKLRQDLSAH